VRFVVAPTRSLLAPPGVPPRSRTVGPPLLLLSENHNACIRLFVVLFRLAATATSHGYLARLPSDCKVAGETELSQGNCNRKYSTVVSHCIWIKYSQHIIPLQSHWSVRGGHKLAILDICGRALKNIGSISWKKPGCRTASNCAFRTPSLASAGIQCHGATRLERTAYHRWL